MNLLKCTNSIYVLILLACFGIISCKREWLDAKPDKSLVVPKTIADYQAFLDNTAFFTNQACSFAEMSTDDYYVSYADWLAADMQGKNVYVWAKYQLEGTANSDWNRCYARLLANNIVLEGISKITPIDIAYNNVKGTALFNRAYDTYILAQEFCKPYDASTSENDLGVALRLTGNLNDKLIRSTVAKTYRQIIEDLKAARNLLPVTPLYKSRPSLPAAYAMLARIYTTMEDYPNAKKYADSCLQIYNTLLDYNTLNTSASRPIPLFNNEVILNWDNGVNLIILSGLVDPTLYSSYDDNDLRKSAFFNSTTKIFKGSYNGSAIHFNGLAVDEVYLIRAECQARTGKTIAALEDLNTLLLKRFATGTFVPIAAVDEIDALRKILIERRKELCYRGLRWTDLRRLNKDPRFAITLTRNLNGEIYTLPPNDLRYTFEIPQNEILITGLEQNQR
ncbi:MAG: RagB/SusD family nutrient uptake outer membrane protein [Candidatus Pedobacter colombiensis]|uniref:RagB/SusD family nutrient uptake outer membrane protein n=1 Tax=Candidatus Pedobacter colombiensis TaxID=3121371 RepID=A0AAJ5W8H5_9SPHI|nr:RagB/SusD family nutrient uptake outer membrane protein [Pedobacter sp.]WEK18402.1 MAG: RagB/SusD family nutrient uptake outer membrane protein [Pedobacter sp.]